jgi:hypothetical protein
MCFCPSWPGLGFSYLCLPSNWDKPSLLVEMGVSLTFCPDWLHTVILPISASQVAGIRSVSYLTWFPGTFKPVSYVLNYRTSGFDWFHQRNEDDLQSLSSVLYIPGSYHRRHTPGRWSTRSGNIRHVPGVERFCACAERSRSWLPLLCWSLA